MSAIILGMAMAGAIAILYGLFHFVFNIIALAIVIYQMIKEK